MAEELESFKLTATQILSIDEISIDKKAIEESMRIHVVHFENRTNELIKANNKWWDELAEIHGLDLASNLYTVEKVNNCACIVLTKSK